MSAPGRPKRELLPLGGTARSAKGAHHCPRLLLSLGIVALLAGCKSLYFQETGQAPAAQPQYRLAAWPDRDYWSGIVFNGQKIGFSHVALGEGTTPGTFEIRSDAAFVLRFMGFDKRVNLKSYDLVREDLDLVAFEYDYVIDGNAVRLAGKRSGDALDVTVTREGSVATDRVAVPGRVYPQAATALYPPLTGLAVGREYRYPVYSGELQKITEVTQRVAAYEKSTLFEGEAFRIETTMEGYRVETWVSPRGAPLLEIAMNGVLISGLESETRARNYLAAASLNKTEALVDFALVRPDRRLASPRAVTMLKIAFTGAPRAPPSDDLQRCAADGAEIVCAVGTTAPATTTAPSPPANDPRYLASTFPIPAHDPAINAKAREIAAGTSDAREQVRRLVAWIEANVLASPADVWTALDVLKTREAECQGHAYLYAAFARALRIPTRVVNGFVYSADYDGFLYHAWTESFVDGRWLAVDPTFHEVPADATHVKLVEGETLADVAPLVDWIGRVKVRVLAVEPAR
jgi:transglutaminase-like putative cysteine protease